MTVLFIVLTYVILLLFLKEANARLHTLLSLVFYVVLFQWIVLQQVLPFFRRLAAMLETMPFSMPILYTVIVLLFAEQLHHLLNHYEYESLAQLLLLTTRLFLLVYWLDEAQLPIQEVVSLLQSL